MRKVIAYSGLLKSLSRRSVVVGLAGLPLSLRVARAGDNHRFQSEMALFFEGEPPEFGGIALKIPELVESGYTVPIAVESVDADAITALRGLAPLNPLVRVASFDFGPMATPLRLSCRIRLARSQEVTVLARTASGRRLREDRFVQVAAGGCGFDLPVTP